MKPKHHLQSKIKIYIVTMDKKEFEVQVQEGEILQIIPDVIPAGLMGYIETYILNK